MVQGSRLLNTVGDSVSILAQECVSCQPDEYILDPNNPRFICQPCPIGAVCDGSSLHGLVKGSVWVADNSLGQYRLVGCPQVLISLHFMYTNFPLNFLILIEVVRRVINS